MARARNIKPSIMENEVLAERPPIARLLFIYLWMLADRDGRLEDRPKRIAGRALPYDRDADVDDLLNQLADGGFISRYAAEGIDLIQIHNFAKHQTPHDREVATRTRRNTNDARQVDCSMTWFDLTPIPGTSNATGKSLALMPGQSQRDCVLNALDEIEFRGLDELHELTGISKDSLSSRLSKMHKAKMIERTVREIPEAKRTPGSNSRRNVYRRGRLAK